MGSNPVGSTKIEVDVPMWITDAEAVREQAQRNKIIETN